MIKKTELMKKAIAMRRKGLTYSAILEKVPVAKSTLALWFKSVKLSVPQYQKLTEAKRLSSIRGGMVKRQQRIKRSEEIISEAEKQIGKISEREKWLIGTVIYWAEGSKEKAWVPGSGVCFINMDPYMVQTFLKWLAFCKVKKKDIYFDLYIHENHKNRLEEIKIYWAKVTNLPVSNFVHVYWKKHKIATKRKNINSAYFGIIKVRVKQSSGLLRQISGWTKGIYKGINNG
jgi:hypothetical protein